MPTLAELKAKSGPPPRPRDVVTVTLVEGQHLLAEVKAIEEELIDLAQERESISQRVTGRDADGNQVGEPMKAGAGAGLSRRAEEIEAREKVLIKRHRALPDELREHQGKVTLTGLEGGDWQRFKDKNPPREDNRQDRRLSFGFCDSSALFNALGQFVTAWDDEPVDSAAWDGWLAEKIAYADRRDLVPAVVNMHENRAPHIPFLSSGSSTTESSATD